MIFDVDTSQQKHHVTTSDTKTELVAITIKPCETCHSVVDVYWFNMHCRLVLIWVEFALNSVNMISKEISLWNEILVAALNVQFFLYSSSLNSLFLHCNFTSELHLLFSAYWFLVPYVAMGHRENWMQSIRSKWLKSCVQFSLGNILLLDFFFVFMY